VLERSRKAVVRYRRRRVLSTGFRGSRRRSAQNGETAYSSSAVKMRQTAASALQRADDPRSAVQFRHFPVQDTRSGCSASIHCHRRPGPDAASATHRTLGNSAESRQQRFRAGRLIVPPPRRGRRNLGRPRMRAAESPLTCDGRTHLRARPMPGAVSTVSAGRSPPYCAAQPPLGRFQTHAGVSTAPESASEVTTRPVVVATDRASPVASPGATMPTATSPPRPERRRMVLSRVFHRAAE